MFIFSFLFFWFSFSERFETCKYEPLKSSPFCNVSLPMDDRITHILSLLSFDEKVNLMDTSGWQKGFEKVKLSPFNWGQEGLHGLASCNFTTYKVTSFPQVINLGATFDIPLIHEMGTAISDEARALSNILAIDLSFWAPNINIFRDPRWGRGQETPGEDPYLTSEYAKAYITGVQYGDDPRYLKAISGCKHYTAYDLENWDAVDRHHFNAVVSKRDMTETFQFPFRAAVVDAGVKQVMCSYPEVNGIPSCVNEYLLTDVLRNEWGFDGHVVADCNAIEDEVDSHGYFLQPEDAVTNSMKHGCDLDCGEYYIHWSWYAQIKGELSSKDLDVNLRRLFKNRMRLGEFDPWEDQPYRKIPTSVISSQKHQQLALDLARESMTLLKNAPSRLTNGLALPLNKSALTKVAVIGPNSEATTILQGDYSGPPPYVISALEGIKSYFPNVQTSEGCTVKGYSKKGFEEALKLARESDVTILVMGYNHWCERESQDRFDLTLTGVQEELIQKIALDTDRKGDLIIVYINGGPIDMTWEKNSEHVQAMIWAGYPSQSGGKAIADVIFGAYNPSGRLVTTVYPKDYVNQVSFFDMNMRPSNSSPGRTYKFYNGEVVYPFGYGLSYTIFNYSWSGEEEMSRFVEVGFDGNGNYVGKNISLVVKNTGEMDGDVSILAFISNTFKKDAPIKKLFGFQRVKGLKIGETREIHFEISQFAVEYVNEDGERVVLPGEYVVRIENLSKTIVVK